jgi:hypothetical protein
MSPSRTSFDVAKLVRTFRANRQYQGRSLLHRGLVSETNSNQQSLGQTHLRESMQ